MVYQLPFRSRPSHGFLSRRNRRVDRRGQEPVSPPPPAPARPHSKKHSSSILSAFQQLGRECLPAFAQQRSAERAQALSLSSLLCLGPHTVTGLLTTCGREFHDGSAEYRLFSRQRFPAADVFSVLRRGVLAELPPQAPWCVAVDDSLLRKTGLRIPGVAWRRDPLGPPLPNQFRARPARLADLRLAPLGPRGLPHGADRLSPCYFTSSVSLSANFGKGAWGSA
jgi:hypothetical protein